MYVPLWDIGGSERGAVFDVGDHRIKIILRILLGVVALQPVRLWDVHDGGVSFGGVPVGPMPVMPDLPTNTLRQTRPLVPETPVLAECVWRTCDQRQVPEAKQRKEGDETYLSR